MIEGAKEMAAVLKRLPDDLAKNALSATARAGAQELQRTAYAYVSMNMNRSAREDDVVIQKRRGKKGDRVEAVYDVGPPRRKPELRWLHDGTKPHEVRISVSTVLASLRLDRVFGRVVQHPGQISRPWLRQAQFVSQDSVLKAMAVKMREALPKQVKKLASSAYRGKQLGRLFR
jgi:hypothetical protein